MLTCPECGLRNLDNVKLCQRCGVWLTCPDCGYLNQDNVMFCQQCGVLLRQPPTQLRMQQERATFVPREPPFLWVPGIVLIGFGLVLLFAFRAPCTPEPGATCDASPILSLGLPIIAIIAGIGYILGLLPPSRWRAVREAREAQEAREASANQARFPTVARGVS